MGPPPPPPAALALLGSFGHLARLDRLVDSSPLVGGLDYLPGPGMALRMNQFVAPLEDIAGDPRSAPVRLVDLPLPDVVLVALDLSQSRSAGTSSGAHRLALEASRHEHLLEPLS